MYLSSFSLGGINVLFTSVSTDSELSFETSPGFDSFKRQKISKSIFLKSLLYKNDEKKSTKTDPEAHLESFFLFFLRIDMMKKYLLKYSDL